MQDVEFSPNVSRDAKVAFLQSLTLFSVPALYPEAFGLYVIAKRSPQECLWCSREVRLFPRSSKRLAAAFLFQPGSVAALVDAWESLLDAPENARALGAAGRVAVHRDYSMQRMAERFLAASREVFDAAGAAY
jgi:glycosyltransferase involved in cell wall biosynthesis